MPPAHAAAYALGRAVALGEVDYGPAEVLRRLSVLALPDGGRESADPSRTDWIRRRSLEAVVRFVDGVRSAG